MIDNTWISVNDRLPEGDKIWIEVIYIYLDHPIEHFYWTECDKWPDGKHTHWRHITHDFFKPVTDTAIVLELPLELTQPAN